MKVMNNGQGYRIEEYKKLRDEIRMYTQNRLQILTVVIPAIGVIIGLGLNAPANIAWVVPVVLYIILAIGVTVSRHSLHQIVKRTSYISAIFETPHTSIKWYTHDLARQAESPSNLSEFLKAIKKSKTLPAVEESWTPHVFPLAYLLLAVLSLLYSLLLPPTTSTFWRLAISIGGFVFVLWNIITLQLAGSREAMISMKKVWHRLSPMPDPTEERRNAEGT